MASNTLIGIPIRLAIGVLAERTRNLALQFPLRRQIISLRKLGCDFGLARLFEDG